MKLIERKYYLDELRQVRGIPDIKVITGLRRSGKSKLLDCFSEEVAKESNTNIIRVNMNLKDFDSLKDPEKLYEYIHRRYEAGKENLLFIDEVQMCIGFETVINTLPGTCVRSIRISFFFLGIYCLL